MATKTQVKNLAKKLGAQFYEDTTWGYTVEIHLPEGKRFAGYNTTVCVQTKMDYETMSEFWDEILNYIHSPIEEEQ